MPRCHWFTFWFIQPDTRKAIQSNALLISRFCPFFLKLRYLLLCVGIVCWSWSTRRLWWLKGCTASWETFLIQLFDTKQCNLLQQEEILSVPSPNRPRRASLLYKSCLGLPSFIAVVVSVVLCLPPTLLSLVFFFVFLTL